MKRIVWLAAACLAVSFPAAADDEVYCVGDAGNSLVFGYIDMSEAPTKASSAWLQQIMPPTETPYWSMGVDDGLFYTPFIQNGVYQLSTIAGSGFMSGSAEYHFPRQGRGEMAVEINQPGIYFLGSFRYVKMKKGGMFKRSKFDIERIESPSEAELLKRILDDTLKIKKSKECDDPRKIKISETVWAAKIRARLEELGK